MSAIDPIVALGTVAIGVVLYQAFVTLRLVKFGGYSVGQKLAKSILVWLVPLVGALFVHFVICQTKRPIPEEDKNFTPQGPQSVG